jgi:WD40 repeat protein
MDPILFVDKVPEDFECPICMMVVKDPVEHTTCQRSFCKECLDQWRRDNCPFCRQPLSAKTKNNKIHRFAKNTYEALRIRCEYEDCTAIFPWPSKAHHEATCSFGPIPCDHCKEGVFRKYMDNHHRDVCTMYPVSCSVQGCTAILPRSRMDDHYRDFGKQHVNLFQAKVDFLEKELNNATNKIEGLQQDRAMLLTKKDACLLCSPPTWISPMMPSEWTRTSRGKRSSDNNDNLKEPNNTKHPRLKTTFDKLSPLHVFTGHIGGINTLVLSESENRLYSGSADENVIKVWDILTISCIGDLQFHLGGVWCLCLSAQRNLLLSGSEDSTIKLCQTQTLQCIHTLTGHTKGVRSLVLDESTNMLYSGADDNSIKVWDLNTLVCLETLVGHEGGVWCLTLSSKSNMLFSGSEDQMIKVWNTVSMECMSTIEGHCYWVWSLCLSEDNLRLYSGSGDNTIKVWDTVTNTCIATLEGHSRGVTALCLLYTANRLISASYDQTIRVWDTITNKCIYTLNGAHRDIIYGLAVSTNNDTVYSGSLDKTIKSLIVL